MPEYHHKRATQVDMLASFIKEHYKNTAVVVKLYDPAAIYSWNENNSLLDLEKAIAFFDSIKKEPIMIEVWYKGEIVRNNYE